MIRGNPSPARPTKARLHVRPVISDFSVREAAPVPPRFVRRAPVPGELLAANNSPAVAVPEISGTEEPFIRPPTKAQLMSRR
jgi:hypothetical protein